MPSDKPTVLFLFNSSLYAPQPWLDDGRFNVVTVDYHETDHSDTQRGAQDASGLHRLNIDLSHPLARWRVQSALNGLGLRQPSLVVSFAPCTDLAVSGAKHFQRKLEADPTCQRRAVRMAMLASQFGCAYAVENPVSVLATMWRKPDLYWHPADFGGFCPSGPHPEFPGVIPERDAYYKKSCLWTGGGFKQPYSAPVAVVEGANPGWAKLGGKSARTKHIRSLTPRGFARAIYLANCEKVLDDSGLMPYDTHSWTP